mgnify:FL=1
MEYTFTMPSLPKDPDAKRPRISWPFKSMELGDTMKVYTNSVGERYRAAIAAAAYARGREPYVARRSKHVELPYSRSYLLVRALDAREETIEQTRDIHDRMALEAYEADLAANEG